MLYIPSMAYPIFAALLGVALRVIFELSDRYSSPLAQMLVGFANIALLWLSFALLLSYVYLGTEYTVAYMPTITVSLIIAALAAVMKFYTYIVRSRVKKRELTEEQKSELFDM